MSTCFFNTQLKRQISFFSYADRGDGSIQSRELFQGNFATFIQNQFGTNIVFFEPIGNATGTDAANDFFVMSEAEIDGAFGCKILSKQSFSCLQYSDCTSFVVGCAATPNLGVSHFAA